MLGFFLALAAAVATALSHVLAKDSLHKQDFSAFLIVRTGAAALALVVVLSAKGDFSALAELPRGLLLALLAMGLLVPFATNIFYFLGLKRLDVNVATPVFHSYPAIAFVLGIVFFKTGFQWSAFVGIAAVLAGVVGFCAPQRLAGTLKRVDGTGIAFLLITAVIMAASTNVWKVLGEKTNSRIICFLGIAAATAPLVIWGLARFRNIQWGSVGTNVKSALSGILVFAVANVLSIAAMKELSPGVVYSVVSSSVLWVGILAFFMLKERWTRLQAASALVLFAGLVILLALAKQA